MANKGLWIGIIVGVVIIVAIAFFMFGNTNKTANVIKNDVGVPVGSSIQKISDIQKTENIGKTVTVQGEVINTLQSSTFHISGYKIKDSTGTIDVSSSKIPQINSTVTVTGTIYQSRYFGLVINETE